MMIVLRADAADGEHQRQGGERRNPRSRMKSHVLSERRS
jgi:hypothetical protein